MFCLSAEGFDLSAGKHLLTVSIRRPVELSFKQIAIQISASCCDLASSERAGTIPIKKETITRDDHTTLYPQEHMHTRTHPR